MPANFTSCPATGVVCHRSMRNLALPLRRLRRLAPRRVELDEAGAGVGEAVAMEGGNGRDALVHALVAVDEQALGLGERAAARHAAAEEAHRVVAPPVVRRRLLTDRDHLPQ